MPPGGRGGQRSHAFTAHRRGLLDRLVPGWKGVERTARSFDINVRELAAWVGARDGRMPRMAGATDPAERRHGKFLSHCRTAARGGQRAHTFTARRREMLDRLVPGWEGVDREDAFDINVRELAAWMSTHDGRMPSARAPDPVEHRVGVFLGRWRNAAHGGQRAHTFTARRRALLDRLVPDWEGVDREDRENAFDGNVRAVAAWVGTHGGQWPSSTATDLAERRHGKFLDNCRQAARCGRYAHTLTARRRELLDQLVPGWKGVERTARSFEINVRELAAWVGARDGRMPSKKATDQVERRHGVFLRHCRTAARGGQRAHTFTARRRALLDRLVPGWEGVDRGR